MATVLRVHDRAGTKLGELPWSTLSRTIVRNDVGSLSGTAPLSEIKPELLDAERYLRVVEDGVEAPDWYVLDDDGDDATNAGGAARPVTIGARGTAAVLEWYTIYPWDHVPGGTLLGLRPEHPFNTSPGGIFAELLTRAQARAAGVDSVINHVTWTFDADVDSAGQPWPENHAITYDSGSNLLKVLQTMAEDGWVDWEMRGFELRLYVPDTVLAVDHPEIVLRKGQGVKQAPRKRSRASIRSTILAVGKEGAIVEVSDPDALAVYGRREGYEGRGEITDFGTLTAATEVSLGRQTSASESLTLALDPWALAEDFPGLPRPGCYVRYDQRRLNATALEPMRVQSIAWDYGDDLVVSVELADMWIDRDVRNQRRIDAILNGSSRNERAPQPPLGDEKPPSTPTGLSLVSAPYIDPVGGQTSAQITATWVPVTTDVDGTPVGELLGYEIQWRQTEFSNGVYKVQAGAGDSLAAWSPVIPDTILEARIAAYDRWHNYSQWSAWEQIDTGLDETAPPRPTAPLVDNYLGLLRVRWDGAFVGGAARPADLAVVEVHVSSVADFAVDPRDVSDGGTLEGTMYAPGPVFVETPYGALRYAKLVAVDVTGNRSEISAQASGATGAVVESDIFDGAVGEAKLKDLAVVNAKIADLAVNDAKIGSLNVGKLIAGTMTAQVILGGRIATGNLGQGVAVVEMNSLGIFRWDAAGVQTVAIDDNGALITGRYRTATIGRRIEMGAAGMEGRVDFYSPNGYNGFVRSWTESGGVEAIQFGMQVPGFNNTLWNRINYNASPNGEYATYKSGTHEFTYDSTAPNAVGRFVVYQGSARSTGYGFVRMQLDSANTYFNSPVGGKYTFDWEASDRYIDFLIGNGPGSSPMMRMNNGLGYGGAIKFYTEGGADAQRLEVRWGGDDGFYAVWAQAFVVQSDAAGKDEIVEADRGSLLAEVVATPPSTYRRHLPVEEPTPGQLERRRGAGARPGRTATRLGPTELGLIAQQAPKRILAGRNSEGGQTIDLYQMASTTWGATGELATIVTAQGRQIEELTAALAALTKGKKDT